MQDGDQQEDNKRLPFQKNLRQTGEGFKLLQEKMSALRPTDPGSLIQFPSDLSVIYEIFGCVRCKKIPHPEYFFVCEEKGHRICSQCAFVVEPEGGASQGFSRDIQPRNAKAVEPCCNPGIGKFHKGPPNLLNTLLMNCTWECKFKDSGCTASIVGSEWSDHVKKCRFYRVFNCQFYGCHYEFLSIEDGMNHLLSKHEAFFNDGPKVTFPISYDDLIKLHRMLALIKWDGGCYLFACEISASTMYMWIWNMQAYEYSDATDAIYKIDLEAGQAADEKAWKNSKSFMSFTGNCLPYKLTAAEVITDEDCLGIPLVRLEKRYLKSEGDKGVKIFTVTAHIKKRKTLESGTTLTEGLVETFTGCSLAEDK